MSVVGALVGATGVGKTALAVSVARKMGAEIICMDSRQVFQGFRIGTAQPSAEEKQTVKHHLVDFLPPGQSYSAALFAQDVRTLLALNPDVPFLLAGGTGLYLKTLCEGLSALPQADPEIRERLRAVYTERGPEALYGDALIADPEIRTRIMPGDTQRLLRVLEVREQGAGRWSDWLGKRIGGIGPVPVVWLDAPREWLYPRINSRVKRMFADGWANEVMELSRRVPVSAPAWLGLGYRDVFHVLNEGRSPDILHDPIAQQTRHYAKRQITWFRHQCESLRLDPAVLSGESMMEIILKQFPVH